MHNFIFIYLGIGVIIGILASIFIIIDEVKWAKDGFRSSFSSIILNVLLALFIVPMGAGVFIIVALIANCIEFFKRKKKPNVYRTCRICGEKNLTYKSYIFHVTKEHRDD